MQSRVGWVKRQRTHQKNINGYDGSASLDPSYVGLMAALRPFDNPRAGFTYPTGDLRWNIAGRGVREPGWVEE